MHRVQHLRRLRLRPSREERSQRIHPDLQARGLRLETNTMAVRLTTEGRRIAEVECVDRVTRQPRRFAGRIVVVAGGALATPICSWRQGSRA